VLDVAAWRYIMYLLRMQRPSVCWTAAKNMATKTSAHVSFLVWLLVLYLDCSLQGAQASPTTEILASNATGRQDIVGKYSEKNVTSSVEDNFVELPEEKLVARSIVYRYTAVYPKQNKPTHRVLSYTYKTTCRILNVTWKTSGANKVVIASGGKGSHYFSIKCSIPAHTAARIEISVTVNAASK